MNSKPGKTLTLVGTGIAILFLTWPSAAYAGKSLNEITTMIPVEMNMPTFLIIGGLLMMMTVLFFLIRGRFTRTRKLLQDLTVELTQTRDHLEKASSHIEQTETRLADEVARCEYFMQEAEVGIFQLDVDGKCIGMNKAMQKYTGLYLKKAAVEGIDSTMHPADRQAFNAAWDEYIRKNIPFELPCRFQPPRSKEIHVVCRGSRLLNKQRKVEGYIGWVIDATQFHEEQKKLQASGDHYLQFIDQTCDGFFHLVPKKPISLDNKPKDIADAITQEMSITTCNSKFAALYGIEANKMKGKTLANLSGGCGAFSDRKSIELFIASNYQTFGLETTRADASGHPLQLLNYMIGLTENNALIGILGSFHDISREKQEITEVTNKNIFLRRILNTIPAEIQVKDPSCRYQFINERLTNRLGIASEYLIGKTAKETQVKIKTEPDHDFIEVMKQKKPTKKEQERTTDKKQGWFETTLTPLISKAGVVEGVVGITIDITDHRKEQEQSLLRTEQIDKQLQLRTDELQNLQEETTQAMLSLQKKDQQLQLREAELERQVKTFKRQLDEKVLLEEQLQLTQQQLANRQKQLEADLAESLNRIERETDHNKKLEQLKTAQETELYELKNHLAEKQKQLEEEIKQRDISQNELAARQLELETIRKEMATLTEEFEQIENTIHSEHDSKYNKEREDQKQLEKQLKTTDALLQSTNARLKELTEQHTTELTREALERKNAEAKLTETENELNALQQQFSQRIEQETTAMKTELAQKQIREKALRENEKELKTRIQELEKTLKQKNTEYDQQLRAREAAEIENKKIEAELEKQNRRYALMIERNADKLDIEMAEVRLEEAKIHHSINDLEKTKQKLEKIVAQQTSELENVKKEHQELQRELTETQSKLEETVKNQATLVAEKSAGLKTEIEQLIKNEAELQKTRKSLLEEKTVLTEKITQQTDSIQTEVARRTEAEKKLTQLQTAYQSLQIGTEKQIEQKTADLMAVIKQYESNEKILLQNEATLKSHLNDLQETIDHLNDELTTTHGQREKIESELAEAIVTSKKHIEKIKATIHTLEIEHQEEIAQIHIDYEQLVINERHYRTLVSSTENSFLQIDPSTGQIQSANRAAAALFGASSTKALSGRTLAQLSPDAQPDKTASDKAARARMNSAIKNGSESIEWLFRKSDGTPFYGLMTLSRVNIEDHQLILAVIQDITSLKNSLMELQQALTTAQSMNAMNSHAVDEIGETLETALAPVVESAAAFVTSSNLRSNQKESLSQINLTCQSVLDMMHYRRELFRTEAQVESPKLERCDLHRLINDVDTRFADRAATKKLFFAVSYAQNQSDHDVPKLVNSDEDKLRKVLNILLGYALANTEKGRVGLHVTSKSIGKDSEITSFELAYTGIEKEDHRLARIFCEKETGKDDSIDLNFGLTLARRYFQMLHGTATIQHRPDGITALQINFPFGTIPDKKVPAKEA